MADAAIDGRWWSRQSRAAEPEPQRPFRSNFQYRRRRMKRYDEDAKRTSVEELIGTRPAFPTVVMFDSSD